MGLYSEVTAPQTERRCAHCGAGADYIEHHGIRIGEPSTGTYCTAHGGYTATTKPQ